jgi:hypothetical protein
MTLARSSSCRARPFLMPAKAAVEDEPAPESPAVDPLALLADLLARMASDPDADAEASEYAQRALARAQAERDAALRSASELSAGSGVGAEPEGVAQAMARCVPLACAACFVAVTRHDAVLNDSLRRSRRRFHACRQRCAARRVAHRLRALKPRSSGRRLHCWGH